MTVTRFGEKPTAEQGTIIMWAGLLTEIPAGWTLCDGNDGTPDLLRKFPRQPADMADLGTVGGENSVYLVSNNMPSHTHTGTTDSVGNHNHTFPTDPVVEQANTNYSGTHNEWGPNTNVSKSGTHTHTASTDFAGSGDRIDNLPKYLEVAYIMKL